MGNGEWGMGNGGEAPGARHRAPGGEGDFEREGLEGLEGDWNAEEEGIHHRDTESSESSESSETTEKKGDWVGVVGGSVRVDVGGG